MGKPLRLSVQREGGAIRMAIVVEEGDRIFSLTGSHSDPQDLEEEVKHLEKTLRELLYEARTIHAKAMRESSMEPMPETLEGLWGMLQRAEGLEAMKRIFNSLEKARRRELADYILSHANVFKGAGAIFAQHYEEEEAELR